MRRTPSNRIHRPPPEPEPILLKLPFALGLIALAGLALWPSTANTVVTFVVEAAVLLGWTVALLEHRRLERIAACRPGESICTFARSFDCRTVDTWVIRAVYEVIQEMLPAAEFPLRSGDRFSVDLPVDVDDVECLAPDMAELCHRTLDGLESNPLFDTIETVGDLVLLLNCQPVALPDAA